MQTYQTMKDSGLKYLGDIPDEWNLLRASVLFKENKQTNTDLLSVEPMQFKLGEIIDKKIDVDEKTKEEIRRYTVVEKDDIMLNGLNLNYDFLTQRVAVVKKSGCITPAYISLRTRKNILPMYATYLLKALDGQKVLNGWGTGIRLTLNYSEFKKYYLPVPSIDTQQRIINYLDEETALIDDLIAKQQHLLELLEEKRRATITNAVTRGLNHNAEFKDTENTWLSEVPYGTTAKQLKFILSLNTGGAWGNDPMGNETDVVVLRSTEQTMTGQWILDDPATRQITKSEYDKTRLEIGDLVITKSSGSELHIGKTSVVDESTQGYSYSNFMQRLRLKENEEPKFYWYLLNSQLAREQYNYYSNSTSGLANLNSTIFNELFFVHFNLDEQQRIAKYLDDCEVKNEALKSKVQEQIDLLKERRTSLISSAVTGKIKV